MTNPYREDIEVWEELREGEEYTVEEFLDALNDPELGSMALYPISSARFDIPTYDHDAETVEIQEEAVETMLDGLAMKAEKEDKRGWARIPSPPRANTYRTARVNAALYSDYTIRIRGDDETIIRLRERDLSRDT